MKRMEVAAKDKQEVTGRKEEKVYFITEASQAVKVENHVLRYWEDELGLPVRRNAQGHRYYTQGDIRLLCKIKKLKDQGLQLKAIKLVLKGMKILPVEDTAEEGGEDIAEERKNLQETRDLYADISDSMAEKNKPEKWKEPSGWEERKEDEPEICVEKAGKPSGWEERKEDEPENCPEKAGKPAGWEERKEDEPEICVEKAGKLAGWEEQNVIPASTRSKVSDEKIQKIRLFIKFMMREAVEEAMQNQRIEIRETIAKEMDYQFRMWQEQQNYGPTENEHGKKRR